jgi:hypothetical protein
LSIAPRNEQLKIPVIRGQVLGITVLRGYAKLCDIASVSKPDIYDQSKNPTGTQRDLNPKHAKAAYEYVKNRELAFWPEVFLCVRDRKAVQYIPTAGNRDFGTLIINLDMLHDSPSPSSQDWTATTGYITATDHKRDSSPSNDQSPSA